MKLGAATDPPCSLEHGDEVLVRMEMRSAELIARKPVGHDDVEAGLRRITSEHRSLEAGIFLGRLLFDLIRMAALFGT